MASEHPIHQGHLLDFEVRPRRVSSVDPRPYADKVLEAIAEEDELLAIINCEVPDWDSSPGTPRLIDIFDPVPEPDPTFDCSPEHIEAENKRCQHERERHAEFIRANRTSAHIAAMTRRQQVELVMQADLLNRVAREAAERAERAEQAAKERERSERLHAKRQTKVYFKKTHCQRGNHYYLRAGAGVTYSAICDWCKENKR